MPMPIHTLVYYPCSYNPTTENQLSLTDSCVFKQTDYRIKYGLLQNNRDENRKK